MKKIAIVAALAAFTIATAAEAGWPIWHPRPCPDGMHAVRTPNGGQRCVPG